MPPHPGDSERRARLATIGRVHIPPVPPGDGPPRPARGVEVFAVGTDRVQLHWRALGPGPVDVRIGPAHVNLATDGGPGAVTVEGLAPATRHRVTVDGAGVPDPLHLVAGTLPRPPGALLHRVAALSDAHVGSRSTGYFHTIVEKPEPAVPHPLRCLLAAVDGAARWGADSLVVKGDLVDASTPANWEQAARALVLARRAGMVVHVMPGNHEWSKRGDGDPVGGLAPTGHELLRRVVCRDVPGARMLAVDTTIPGADHGRLSTATTDVADLAAEVDTPVIVAMHHQPTRHRFPTYLPFGVPGPEARRFLSTLGRANPASLVTAGHTHRHRRRRHGPVTVVEVGSTKDYPGTWAAYEIYEGGIVQTAFRIDNPDCIRWTEHTARAALGVWRYWSPGTLDDRSFTLTW